MTKIQHPSTFINSQSVEIIRKHIAEAEQMKALHPAQLDVIYKNRWFNLYVPIEYGGLGLSLNEGLKIEETLAWVDGSLGWTVTLCSGANWFIGFLQQDTARILFHTDKVCFAGSGRPSGIAKIVSNDCYEISGSWQYATGSAHATAFTANCLIEEAGKILLHEDGTPFIASFIFLRNEVIIYEDWKGMGMVAASNNRFEVSRLRVDSKRRFEIDESKTVLQDEIYKYPFLQFAESTLAVIFSGMAFHFMDLFRKNINEKKLSDHFTKENRQPLILLNENARQKQEDVRGKFYQALQNLSDEWNENKHFSAASLGQVSKVSRKLAAVSRELVDEIFPFCGLLLLIHNQK